MTITVMLNPVWIQTFATVAAARSFTEAGRQLGLSQSSVSDHIRRLEQSVGRRLFVRDTHSLSMTPDGEALLVHARLILEALARAESQFTAPRLRGRVRLGTSEDLAQGRCRACSRRSAIRIRTWRWKSPSP
ncbi:hypothetical protein AWV80_28725 [Cupriavidus sp. UYMU48A]|nr:hypothetical protein AWV80_28725 [Cupriavidus sp. UYMU48A]